jgi:hypothetical protein
MDDLLIKNYFSESEKENIIKDVYEVLEREKDLSKRSFKELDNFIRRKELYCLYKDKKIIGFILKSKLSSKMMEIQGLYIDPEFRERGYSLFLMDEVTKDNNFRYVGVTFNPKVKKRLVHIKFKETSFNSLRLTEKVNFLISRLSKHRVFEIRRHFKENKKVSIFIK